MRAPADSDDRSRLVLPLLGWLAGAAFFFYAWILRVAPSVMVEELMLSLIHISEPTRPY